MCSSNPPLSQDSISVGENDTRKLIILCISLRANKQTLLGETSAFWKQELSDSMRSRSPSERHWVHFGNGHISHTNEWKHLSEKNYWQKPWRSSLSINWSFRPSLSFINQFWLTVLLYAWPERDTERTCQDSRSEVSPPWCHSGSADWANSGRTSVFPRPHD